MKNSYLIFFILILVMTLFLITLIIYLNQPTKQTYQKIGPLSTSNELVEQYQSKLVKVIEDFLVGESFLNSDKTIRNQALKDLENQLLTLTVPVEYKELHLKLVIAINKLKSDDLSEIQQSQQFIEEQLNQYWWLKPVLSLFLINLY